MENQHEEEWVSKTQMKKQMDVLQDLGMELTELSSETITSNSALKRQRQYIGRLMRDIDPAPIRDFLAKLKGDNQAHNAFLQRVEQARTRLLASDDALTAFVSDFPHADVGTLRTLIRNARKEAELNKPPKAFRALYQELKVVMEGHEAE